MREMELTVDPKEAALHPFPHTPPRGQHCSPLVVTSMQAYQELMLTPNAHTNTPTYSRMRIRQPWKMDEKTSFFFGYKKSLIQT